jgi:hypothetical protein
MRSKSRFSVNLKCAAKKLIAAVLCGLFVSSAEAQETPPPVPSYFDFPTEELTQVSVKSAAFFERDVLTVGSSVSVIERAEWKAELVLFQNDWEDGILLRLDPSSSEGSVYKNPGENQARGIEASWAWYPAPCRLDLEIFLNNHFFDGGQDIACNATLSGARHVF